ncbi:MAG: 50S ribosomal protein L32 [Parcubacteria group bacterium]|nr:50S ribosomal protein L32 [Parcubacteria group bacterium]
MAVPKKHTTKGSRDQKRMHLHLHPSSWGKCPKCGKPVRRHMVCTNCGFYKGKEIIDVMAKLEKKERKRKQEEIKEGEKEQEGQKPLTMEELSKQKF